MMLPPSWSEPTPFRRSVQGEGVRNKVSILRVVSGSYINACKIVQKYTILNEYSQQ